MSVILLLRLGSDTKGEGGREQMITINNNKNEDPRLQSVAGRWQKWVREVAAKESTRLACSGPTA